MKTVKIEKLIFGGYGLGRGSDGVVLIPDVAANEVVEYENDGLQGGTRVGRVTRIIESSHTRRNAPCVYADVCGGCNWIHLNYNEQVRCKKEIFFDCVDRIGKFKRFDDIKIFTAGEFGYRMRAQIKIDRQNKCVGFYRRKSNDVIKIDGCPLLVDGINDILTKLNCGAFDAIPSDAKYIKALVGKNTASNPVIGNLTNANTDIEAAGITFKADGGSFFQSNKFLLETLGRWAKEFTAADNVKVESAHKPVSDKFCLDLYGGIGFFALMFADDFTNIVSVENVAAQVSAANLNFHINGKNHLKAALTDATHCESLNNLVKERKPNFVIVDPPRNGLVKNTRKWLVDTAPPAILYVSCNPSTFARDAGALIKGGYELSNWALFDLYPNTHHIEVEAIFIKPKSF